MHTFPCKGCGKEVTKWIKEKGKFCTARCYYAWKVQERGRKCKGCGKRYTSFFDRLFCSAECRQIFIKAKKEKVCKQCGKVFIKNIPSSSKTYCSRKCAGLAHRLKSREFTCLNCEKHVVTRMIRSRPRKFCSLECRKSYARGKNHPLWRGNSRLERGPTWRGNSRLARERDKRCVAPGCGKEGADLGQKLSVDHIVPFRLTVLYGQTDGVDPNHLDNLACLCRAHHGLKTHTAEAKLLRGDLMGFRSDMATILPLDRLERALSLWNLGAHSTKTLLPFEGVPTFMQ